MDTQHQIEPHKITKPIQLLAAWLSGLVLIDGLFLYSASNIPKPDWVTASLVVAGIINVPLFLFSIFLLQTKFRPEMQEDSFYLKYLESKTGNTERKVTAESFELMRQDVSKLEIVVAEKALHNVSQTDLNKLKWSSVTVMLNENINIFTQIVTALSGEGIPVHETFGSGAGIPRVLSVAVGNGFDVDQIRVLVYAILKVLEGWICFANDIDEVKTFEKKY